ncbi:TetR family transcriptional regulator [Actinoplanes sp. NBRC 103695]|nr:TetR family transcriptional regulator [Actinoplanes sp. NBRC 103695]
MVAAGAAIADEVGLAGLTMGLLAERVGVRPPSLYKHVGSLAALRHGIAIQAERELGDALARAAAGRSGPEAVHAFADAYRRWVLDHPGRYAATIHVPPTGDECPRALLRILAGFGLRETGAVEAARTVRSVLHGFVSLEGAGGFGLPRDIDRSYRILIDALVTGLRSPGHAGSAPAAHPSRPSGRASVAPPSQPSGGAGGGHPAQE